MLMDSHCFQVCKIVEGQRYSKRLNERQITALLKVTCQRPHDREQDIMRVRYLLLLIFSFLLPPFPVSFPSISRHTRTNLIAIEFLLSLAYSGVAYVTSNTLGLLFQEVVIYEPYTYCFGI